jgi:hypothetical protein
MMISLLRATGYEFLMMLSVSAFITTRVVPLRSPFSSYYDRDAADKVGRIFAWEIAQFGYHLNK